jgi:benzodiazapine receptor
MVGILIYSKAPIFTQLYVLLQLHTKTSLMFVRPSILTACEIIAQPMDVPKLPAQTRGMAVLVMLATIAVVVVNFLAATGRINGVLPNDISDKYPTVITPAGWAFSIWGLIYVGLIGFSIFQLLGSKASAFVRVRMPYIVSCILNCAWILFWHHFHTGICALLITLLLASLFRVMIRLEDPGSFVESILTKGVFGLYAGWLTVATLVNLVVYLVSCDVQLSATGWNVVGILCLAAAVVAALIVRVALRNFVYPLPIAWAAAGIGANQSGNTPVVVAAAITCVACLVISGTVVTELKGSNP